MAFYFNNSTSSIDQTIRSTRLMDNVQVKILFAIIMACLCALTSIGNICVIYRFRKASFVSYLLVVFNSIQKFNLNFKGW